MSSTASAAGTLDPSVAIGARVRSLREARGLSLRDLAARAGVSAAMLSQVERGATSPSIAVAGRIAAGLAMTLSQLLRLEEGRHVAVVRAGDRRPVRAGGHRYHTLTPDLPGQRTSITTHALKPRARTGGAGDAPIHEPGSRETILVRAGTVTLSLDGERYELTEGDSVTFDADLPHHLTNTGRRDAEFLAVVTAGLRTV